jgi:hypothetical protein
VAPGSVSAVWGGITFWALGQVVTAQAVARVAHRREVALRAVVEATSGLQRSDPGAKQRRVCAATCSGVRWWSRPRCNPLGLG